MKHFLKTIFSFCLILFIASCSTPSFLPQTHNAPLFTDKNQLHVNPSLSLRTFDLQVAYSPTNYLGVITNLQVSSRYNMAEIGVGAFQTYGNKLVTEFYLGYGNGRIKTDQKIKNDFLGYDYVYYNVEINANKYFFQPNIGIKFNDKINLSFSTRLTYWDYSHYYYYTEKWQYDSGSYWLAGKDTVDSKNCSAITIEPALSFRVGGDHTKFMIQTGLCPVFDSGANDFSPYRNTYAFIRLGVCVYFDLFNKKKDLPVSQ